jgi:hypothetical protein
MQSRSAIMKVLKTDLSDEELKVIVEARMPPGTLGVKG